jgi:Chaperone of endosialidase
MNKPIKTLIRRTFLRSAFILSALASFAVLPKAQAVSPAPDGGYPGGNTAEGQNALLSLTTGGYNTAVGFLSLRSNATGQLNTALGAGTLLANTGDSNTATGAAALLSNTAGDNNTATGAFALFSNTSGFSNTASGLQALFANTEGHDNSALGVFALASNTSGIANTAVGQGALQQNTQGGDNTAVGRFALFANVPGSSNTAVGVLALGGNAGGVSNTAVGRGAGQNITGNSNICVGADVSGVAGESNTIRIGDNLPNAASACFIGGIFQETVGQNFGNVVVDINGKLGITVSSRRFKDDIQPMDRASEAIFALEPVTFHYKSDEKKTPCFGLIAEEVAKVNPDLIVRGKGGTPLTVHYEQINAMLLNEFLKEHKKVEQQRASIAELQSTVAEQRKGMDVLTAQLKEQAAQIRKVSARVETNTSARKIVLNSY